MRKTPSLSTLEPKNDQVTKTGSGQTLETFRNNFCPAGMSNFWDESIHNITLALKRTGMWNKTLLIMSGDNGGPGPRTPPSTVQPLARATVANRLLAAVYTRQRLTWCLVIYLVPCHACLCACLPACCLPAVYWTETPAYPHGGSANNYPLKGGKSSTLEGGVRVSAFASGGMIPPAMRGKVFSDPSQMIHVCDWYVPWYLLYLLARHSGLELSLHIGTIRLRISRGWTTSTRQRTCRATRIAWTCGRCSAVRSRSLRGTKLSSRSKGTPAELQQRVSTSPTM